MFTSLFLPTLLLSLTTAALPTANADFKPLVPRFNEATSPSRCLFDPHFLGYRTKLLTSRPAKAEVTITDKTTDEKGETGSGLHDNLLGECGHDEITQWQAPSVLATKPWSNEVAAYNVWFNVGSVMDPACIERAIWKAEQQNVTCTGF